MYRHAEKHALSFSPTKKCSSSSASAWSPDSAAVLIASSHTLSCFDSATDWLHFLLRLYSIAPIRRNCSSACFSHICAISIASKLVYSTTPAASDSWSSSST